MTTQLNETLCGQCRVHSDCVTRYSNQDALCLHRLKANNEPDNYCVSSCVQNVTASVEEPNHGQCEYDENAGMDVWKCHFGY